jgi:hypothetical protein
MCHTVEGGGDGIDNQRGREGGDELARLIPFRGASVGGTTAPVGCPWLLKAITRATNRQADIARKMMRPIRRQSFGGAFLNHHSCGNLYSEH